MDELRIEDRGGARWLILNRPERRNALSRDLMRAVHGAVEQAADEPAVRSLVLAGAGPSFCAGADLTEFRQADDPEVLHADGERLARLLAAIARSPKPVIARVHGAAVAGAVGLIAAADFAVAAEDARFSLSEVRIGLVPAVISPFLLRALGRRAAQALMLSGLTIDAGEALRVGLVQTVVEPAALDAAVDQLTAALALAAPGALGEVKGLVERVAGLSFEEAREPTIAMLAARRASAEGQEGMRAFLEKRRPDWVVS